MKILSWSASDWLRAASHMSSKAAPKTTRGRTRTFSQKPGELLRRDRQPQDHPPYAPQTGSTILWGGPVFQFAVPAGGNGVCVCDWQDSSPVLESVRSCCAPL